MIVFKRMLSDSGVMLAFLFLILMACTDERPKPKEVLRPVKTTSVKRIGGAVSRTFSGRSKTGTKTRLSFRIGGIVNTVKVKVGQQVKKGRLIAALDDKDDQLKLGENQAAVQNAAAQKQAAFSNLSRVKMLYENNNIALSEYDAAKSRASAAEAELDAAQKRLSLQKSKLTYADLYAPVDAIVTRINIEKNENVQPGQVVVELSSGDDIEVTVGVPEVFIGRIATGDKVSVYFPTFGEKVYQGVVSEVAFSSSAASTYPVTVKVEQADRQTGVRLRPGMPADVKFALKREMQEYLVVPGNSVLKDTSGNYLFVLIASGEKGIGLIKRKDVTVGRLTTYGFEIKSGLTGDEQVVSSGVSKIKDGMKVRFDQE